MAWTIYGKVRAMDGRRYSRLCSLLLLATLGMPSAAQDSPRFDPEIIPAQGLQTSPAGTPPVNADPPPTSGVADPPTPQVRIQVRAKGAVAPGKDIAYKIFVSNPSQATAYKVLVRNPLPDGTQFLKSIPEPKPRTVEPGKRPEIIWEFETLEAGKSREIDLILRPVGDVREIQNQAFVSFEHGQAVRTKIERPKLTIRKDAPPRAAQGEPIPVQVTVTNSGPVTVADVEIVEDISPGFEFVTGTSGDRGSRPEQRIWKLGTLVPNQTRTIQYRVSSKTATKLLTTSAVRGAGVTDEPPKQSETEVLTTGLTVELTGPAEVPGGEPANYKIIVRNTGALALTDVRVTGSHDPECKLVGMTNGGQRYRDQVVWVIPQLSAGDAVYFTMRLDSPTTGRRLVRAAAVSARGIEAAREMTTQYQGTAVLQLRATPEPALVGIGKSGLLTLDVANRGSETARNVKVKIKLPPGIQVRQSSPGRPSITTNEVIFEPIEIRGNESERYTLTYTSDRVGQAYFIAEVLADGLGGQPLVKSQAVEITK